MSRPLVLLHGFTGSPESWAAVRMEIGATVETVAPPLLGHGVSPDAADTFEEEVDRLARVVRDARAEGAHLAGYSLGARLGLGLLARHPTLFHSATLIAPHPGLTDAEARRARIAEDAARASHLREEGLASFLARWESLPLFATQSTLPAAVREGQRAVRLAHDAEGLARSLEVLGLGRMPSHWWLAGELAQPLCLLVGAEDTKFLDLGRRFVEGSPRARLDVVPDAGHNLPLEAPSVVAAAILRGLTDGENP